MRSEKVKRCTKLPNIPCNIDRCHVRTNKDKFYDTWTHARQVEVKR